jgi:hypothetical protein
MLDQDQMLLNALRRNFRTATDETLRRRIAAQIERVEARIRAVHIESPASRRAE